MGRRIIRSTDMTVGEMIARAIELKGMKKKDIAAKMGWSSANFANRMRNVNSINANEWIKLASILGYEVQMVDVESKEVLREKKHSSGSRAVQMIDYYTYDTDNAEAICHTPKTSNGWFELFRDIQTGQFFTVARLDTQGSACIALISAENAKKFYEDCGGEQPNIWFK